MPLNQVTIESENPLGSLPVYVSSGNHTAGVIVLQEWWGANEQIKGRAEQWYSDKYVALVPDLYRGKVATDHETAGHYFNDLNWQGAIQDIQAAVRYLNSKGCTKVGVVGFCMGGALSLAAASLCEGINASCPFYGYNGKLGDPALVKCPLQLHFGTNDQVKGFSDIETQDKLEQILKDSSRVFEFFRYEGANHGFTNETKPENYNKEYTDLAHKRTLEFYAKYLN